MSQLIIADLNFLDSEFASKSEVKGGGKSMVSQDFSVLGATATYKATWDATYKVGPRGEYAVAAGVASGAAASQSGPRAQVTTDVDVDTRI